MVCQVHLLENDVLRSVFEVTENSNAKMSMVSTVQRRADNKSRSKYKRNDLSKKNRAQNDFLYGE